jgi:hypothetical protein
MQEELRNLAEKHNKTFEEVLELWKSAKNEVSKAGTSAGSPVFYKRSREALNRMLGLVSAPVENKAEAPKKSKK